jgi:hypothetical protein
MLLEDLGTFLQSNGLGTLAISLFLGSVPMDDPRHPTPDELIALIEVPGLPPVRTHDTARYEQPMVQVLTRGEPHGYAAARHQAEDAWLLLDGLGNQALSGTFYLWIVAMQSPYFLHTDARNRPVILFNIRCAKAL